MPRSSDADGTAAAQVAVDFPDFEGLESVSLYIRLAFTSAFPHTTRIYCVYLSI